MHEVLDSRSAASAPQDARTPNPRCTLHGVVRLAVSWRAQQWFCTEMLPVAGRGTVWQYTAILVRLPASEPWRLWEPVTLPGRRGCVSPKLAAPSRARAVIGQPMFLERKRRRPQHPDSPVAEKSVWWPWAPATTPGPPELVQCSGTGQHTAHRAQHAARSTAHRSGRGRARSKSRAADGRRGRARASAAGKLCQRSESGLRRRCDGGASFVGAPMASAWAAGVRGAALTAR